MPSMFRLPQAQLLGVSGLPAAGARLYFFEPSTTTPKNAFSDAALTIPVAQGIAADANGAWPTIYMSPALYRVQVRAADAVTILQDVDPYDGGQAIGGGVVPIERGGTGGSTATTARANLGITTNQPAVTLASAATVDLGAADSDNIVVTGSVTVTSFGSSEAGRRVTVIAQNGFSITPSANMSTPGNQPLRLTSGDSIEVLSYGGGAWTVLNVQRYIGATIRAVGSIAGNGAVGYSEGLASVLRVAVGQYDVTFSVAMPDTNYIPLLTVIGAPGAVHGYVQNRTTTLFRVVTTDAANAVVDSNFAFIVLR
jgi:hypothetical protein